MRRYLFAASFALCIVAVAGCAAGGLGPSTMFLGALSLSLLLAACSSIKTNDDPRRDAATHDDAASAADATRPGLDAAANGDATSAADAHASDATSAADAQGDAAHAVDGSLAADAASNVDAGPAGSWERCCRDFEIDMCFCPEGLACNYGWFIDCGGDYCVPPTLGCPSEGNVWNRCCLDGEISYCECPIGAACNYRVYECDDGSCSTSGPSGCSASS